MSQDYASVAGSLERAPDTSPPSTIAAERGRNGFARGMALAMLLLVLVGFSPTFFLRIFFNVPDIPPYLLVHGAVSTTWFVLFFVQAALVSRRRLDLHRYLGIAGAIIGLCVLASGIQTCINLVPRLLAAGVDLEANMARYNFIVSANFSAFIVFPTLLSLALYFRRRPHLHRRLMLLTSISILGPAAMRVASWFGDVPNVVLAALILSFLLALIVNDIVTQRRPHFVSLAGIAFMFGMNASFRLAGIGRAIIELQSG